MTLEGAKEEAAGEGYVEDSGVDEDGEAEALAVVVMVRVGVDEVVLLCCRLCDQAYKG